MPKQEDKISIEPFPAPTLSQLEYVLEERQNKDRRKNSEPIAFEERRKRQRRAPNISQISDQLGDQSGSELSNKTSNQKSASRIDKTLTS